MAKVAQKSAAVAVTIVSDVKAYLGLVKDTAFQAGKAQSAMVALLASGAIVWSNDDHVSSVARAYRIGRMAASLGYTLEKATEVELAGKAKRNEAETKAYNAAKVSWGETARSAGMPKKDMTPRAPRPTAEDAKAKAEAALVAAKEEGAAAALLSGKAALPKAVKAKVELAQALETKAKSLDEVQAFAVFIAKQVEAFERRTAKSVERGPFRSILWDFVKAVNKAAAAPEVAAPAHPVVNGASAASVASVAVHAAA